MDVKYLEMVMDGDLDFLENFVRSFKDSLDILLPRMKLALSKDDWTNLKSSAHKLKSVTRMLQLKASGILDRIEENPEVATEDDLQIIEKECHQALDFLINYSKDLQRR